MKTQKYLNRILKSGTISEEMIGACIHSINLQAKHYRKLEHQSHGKAGEILSTRYMKKKDIYYAKKAELLSYFLPKEILDDKTNRYYRYEIGGYRFHQPCSAWIAGANLPVKEVPIFDKFNCNKDTVSLEFCDRVIRALATGKCHISYTTTKPRPLEEVSTITSNKDIAALFEQLKRGDRS